MSLGDRWEDMMDPDDVPEAQDSYWTARRQAAFAAGTFLVAGLLTFGPDLVRAMA